MVLIIVKILGTKALKETLEQIIYKLLVLDESGARSYNTRFIN